MPKPRVLEFAVLAKSVYDPQGGNPGLGSALFDSWQRFS